ncbi:uncharacterized protein LOC129941858 [Eupeodes corollae]|uniref:uncharacterized protein LOC129941858 n=1 Tax=Eupeodes corollae TaxID=290404 RepID=UPI002492815D|nr:uncharacterized protein LOC129941858 [Eupeodes corollae]
MSNNRSMRSMVRVLSKQKCGLRICHINAQSLLPKIDEFRDIFTDSDVDVICVTETWLRDELNDDICCLEGYRVFRFNRVNRVGGGVAIYVKRTIKCKLKLSATVDSTIEYLFVEVVGNDGNLLLGTIYRPNRYIDFSPLYTVLEEISLSSPNIVLCGDFNCNLLNTNVLTHNMQTYNLKPANTNVPTHYFGRDASLLDLMFVSDIHDVAFYDQLSAPAFSKHDLIFLTLRFSLDFSVEKITYRDFHNINIQELGDRTREINWDAMYYLPSSNDQIEFLTYNISNLFNTHVPLKTKILKPNNKPWFTVNIRNLIQQRDDAYTNWKRYRLNELRRAFCSLRNRVVAEIRKAKAKAKKTRHHQVWDSYKESLKKYKQELRIAKRSHGDPSVSQ